MDDEDQFIPDLNALLEVSLVEENAENAQSLSLEETQTTVADDAKAEETKEDVKQSTEPPDKSPVATEPAEPETSTAEPVPNGADAEVPFKVPDVIDVAEQQKEIQNFKVSLLPKDISDEEKAFYLNAIDDIRSVTCMRLHCTVCNDHIGCRPDAEENTFSHINLHVLVCKQCYEFYGNGDFTVGADGSETYCYWCGQGGQVFCCSTCTHVFCKKCVRVNFGRKVQKEIDDSNEWACYACSPSSLWEFRAQCWGLLTYNEMRKNDLVKFSSDEELHLPGYNMVECCNVQRRAGKPLKIISFRYLIAIKKQEREKEKKAEAENATVNNKNKTITESNGTITYPYKILPKILRAEGDPVIPSTKETSSNPPVPTALLPAIKVRTPGTMNAEIFTSPVSPNPHTTSEVIVPTSGSGGVNTSQRVNYVNTPASSVLKNNAIMQRRTAIQRKPGSSYLLVGTQSGNSALVPFNTVNSVGKRPLQVSRKVPIKPVTIDDDDDDVIIIDDAFDNGVKKMELEWLVKSLEQAEKVSKTFQRHCEKIKQTFMSEVKNNKIDAKRIKLFSGKMHHLLKRTAVNLACLDDKYVTEAFSNWLKSEKLKHQKVPAPEPNPKTDAELCLDMEISCESDNEEAEDDFETVFKKSVLECSETLSDVEFEDDVLNNITSSMQRDHLTSLQQQVTRLKKQQCDMCIQTDHTELEENFIPEETDTKKAEWSGAYSDFLINLSESKTSKQNGAPSLNSDKTDPDDKSLPPSEIEFSGHLIEEAQCDKAETDDKSPPHSENELSDPLIQEVSCDKENIDDKSSHSVKTIADPLIEEVQCDKAETGDISQLHSENKSSDHITEEAQCNKAENDKSPPHSENESSEPLLEAAETGEKSHVHSENESSDHVTEQAQCNKAEKDDKSPLHCENESSDLLSEAAQCDKAETGDKSQQHSENESSDLLSEEAQCEKVETGEKSQQHSENESSDLLSEAAPCDKAETGEKSQQHSENESSDLLSEAAPCDKAETGEKSQQHSENDSSDLLSEEAQCDKVETGEKSQQHSENESSDPVIEEAQCNKTNTGDKSSPPLANKSSDPLIKEPHCVKVDSSLSHSENEPSNLAQEEAPQTSNVPDRGVSLKRARSRSPGVDPKKRRLQINEKNTPLKSEKQDDLQDKYRKFGLKNCTIKLTDIDINE